MSDSDSSDDELLTKATFKRPSRTETRKANKAEQFLNNAVKQATASHHSLWQLQVAPDDDRELAKAMAKAQEQPIRRTIHDVDEDRMDDAFTKDYWKQLLHAMDESQSMRLGVRATLRVDAAASHATFNDSAAAQEALVKSVADWKEQPLVGRLQQAMEADILPELLSSNRFPTLLQQEADSKLVHVIFAWLRQAAYSANRVPHMAMAAWSVWEQLPELAPAIKLRELTDLLNGWVAPTASPSSSGEEKEAAAGDKNVLGLTNLLSIVCTSPKHLQDVSGGSETVDIVKILIRLSLDSSANVSLQSTIQLVLSKILNGVYDNNQCDFVEWSKRTVQLVLQDISKLGAGTHDDEDDQEAWLCHSAAVKSVALIPQSQPDLLFGAELAVQTIEKFFKSSRRDMVQVAAKTLNCELSACSWQLLGICYASIEMIEHGGVQLASADPAATLSVVECLLRTYQVALFFLSHDIGDGQEFGTKDNAQNLSAYLEPFDGCCQRVTTHTIAGKMVQNHLFGRANKILNFLHQLNCTVKNRADRIAGTPTGAMEQTTLTSFFAKKATEQPL